MQYSWTKHDTDGYALADVEAADYGRRRQAVERQHRRDVLTAEPAVIELDTWTGDLAPQRMRIIDRDLSVEMFGTPSTRGPLLVLLSSGGGASKDGTEPEFPRANWHAWFEGVCVSIDDPTFAAFPGALNTGWYLGTHDQDAVATLAAIIERIRFHYGIDADEVFILGAASGGTAALKLAAAVPGATAIAENPPIYPHRDSSAAQFQRVGLALDTDPLLERNSLEQIVAHNRSRFLILQNGEDTDTLHQLRRLLDEAGLPMPGVGLSEAGSLSLYITSVPAISPHHVFLSAGEFRSVLRVAGRGTPSEMRAVVLDTVHESLRGRTLANDRARNLQGWARLLPQIDLPALLPPPAPGNGAVVRLPLAARPDIAYRLRLSHRAKQVFIAVNLPDDAADAHEAEIAEIVSTMGANAMQGTDGTTLSIAQVPIDRAAQTLREFVGATAALLSAGPVSRRLRRRQP